ncbi:MAG: prolipoprotein diacylglyceryl transferase family protein [Myxococcota bacterium]
MSQLPPQSVFFGLAILSALVGVLGLSWRARYDVATAFGLFSLAAVAAVVGARLVWVVASPEAGISAALEQPAIVWHPLSGGFASLGGWVGAVGALALATVGWSRSDRWRLADVTVPPALLGLAMARLGCLANGCDYGIVREWGIRYASDTPAYRSHVEEGLLAADAPYSLPTFPLPPSMSGATLLIAAAAFFGVRRFGVGKTAVFASGAYFFVRLVLEFFRAPETVESIAGPFNVNQVLALGGLVATVAAWRFFRPAENAGVTE